MQNQSFIDTHIHSVNSNEYGCDLSTQQILDHVQKQAQDMGKLCTISITDHNNSISALEAYNLQKDNPDKYNFVNYISGIEFSVNLQELGLKNNFATYNGMHILAYNFNPNNSEMIGFSKVFNAKTFHKEQEIPICHNIMVLQKKFIETYGEGIPYEELAKCLDDSKTYFEVVKKVRACCCKHFNKTESEMEPFFNRCFDSKQVYIIKISANTKPLLSDIARIVKSAGGVLAIAHPSTISTSELGKRQNLMRSGEQSVNIFIDKFKALTGDLLVGIEAYHKLSMEFKHSVRMLKRVAEKYNLYITGGSDYHASSKDIKTEYGNLLGCKFNSINYENQNNNTTYLTSSAFVDKFVFNKECKSKQETCLKNQETVVSADLLQEQIENYALNKPNFQKEKITYQLTPILKMLEKQKCACIDKIASIRNSISKDTPQKQKEELIESIKYMHNNLKDINDDIKNEINSQITSKQGTELSF